MSNFTPTQAELALVSQVFAVADPQGLGIVQGDAAVKAFSGSNLSPSILGDIWSIADKENNGFLTRKGVAMALRLIAHVQPGEELSEDLLTQCTRYIHSFFVHPAYYLFAPHSWAYSSYSRDNKGRGPHKPTEVSTHTVVTAADPCSTYLNTPGQDKIHPHVRQLWSRKRFAEWFVVIFIIIYFISSLIFQVIRQERFSSSLNYRTRNCRKFGMDIS